MTVSVVITCFNEGPWIEQAVRSVLAQTAADRIVDILILDDGSGAETLEALERVRTLDPRIALHFGDCGGVAHNRNRGVALSKGAAVAFLDGDDHWAPDKLARQLAVLEGERAPALVYTGYFSFSEGGAAPPRPMPVADIGAHPDPALRYFLNDPPILPSSVLLTREAFERNGGFEQIFSPFEDTDFFFRLARIAPVVGLPEPLIYKRYHPNSLSWRSPQLMQKHALVAFRAAALEPRLLPLAPRRIGERAARLALVYWYGGETLMARRLARTALAMQPANRRALAVLALSAGGAPLRAALAPWLKSRLEAHAR